MTQDVLVLLAFALVGAAAVGWTRRLAAAYLAAIASMERSGSLSACKPIACRPYAG